MLVRISNPRRVRSSSFAEIRSRRRAVTPRSRRRFGIGSGRVLSHSADRRSTRRRPWRSDGDTRMRRRSSRSPSARPSHLGRAAGAGAVDGVQPTLVVDERARPELTIARNRGRDRYVPSGPSTAAPGCTPSAAAEGTSSRAGTLRREVTVRVEVRRVTRLLTTESGAHLLLGLAAQTLRGLDLPIRP